ncbi:CPBP family intramembrane glutamic endopeptidase [Staphylococcus lutrae]|uniref:CPBP family intramembrane metalloprotease n=1 Tax=Staphylococcus lutrae TaxID=155085 RepID=A0AAC9RWL1_9STAP|nr:type II CAAX endopeptidase family protein [Staphylococcus lutrae]ARJ51232.1 CPBP family intramembrane metalloprotease [Staphylococcus lutrae]PNZ39477.1 CPBP family intramembrane metalloprotease [Staphylococcus lutrae]
MTTSSKNIAWRDLWAIAVLLVVQQLLKVILNTGILSHHAIPDTILLLLADIITSLSVILYLAWSHRHGLTTHMADALRRAKKHLRLMIWAYVLYMVSMFVTHLLIYFLPEQWQYKETGNQEALTTLFHEPALLPVIFLSLVVISPITEELLFRHLLIGVIGQKFGITFMGVVSIVFFAMLHMSAAHSPFEILPYLLLAILFVVTYIKSGCNIAVSIMMHMFNNGISFVGVILQVFYL